mgnify:FL=1|tara:strand:- start:2413 stop:2655 length:243 start_codon:yes stop_codon:yes gene_type:complete
MTTKHSLEKLVYRRELNDIELNAEFEVKWDEDGKPDNIFITKAAAFLGPENSEVHLLTLSEDTKKFLMERMEEQLKLQKG